MRKKKKIAAGVIIAAIVTLAAASVLLFAFTREKGEWVYYDSYRPQGKLVSELGRFTVWPQEVNEETISDIFFYRYKFRKKIDVPVVKICIVKIKTGEIVSSVDAAVSSLSPTESETEPIIFAGYPSLNGKRMGGKLIMYAPPTEEAMKKRVEMVPKVFTREGKSL